MRNQRRVRAMCGAVGLSLFALLVLSACGGDEADVASPPTGGAGGRSGAGGNGGSSAAGRSGSGAASSNGGASGGSGAGSGGSGGASKGGSAGGPVAGGGGSGGIGVAGAPGGGSGFAGSSGSAGSAGESAAGSAGQASGGSTGAGTGGQSPAGAGGSDAKWERDPCNDPSVKPTPDSQLAINESERTIHGTPGNDVIFGRPGGWKIMGGDGDDIICAGSGNDIVEGGAGKDYIDGGDGQDRLFGGPGDDIIHGRGMGDVIYGNEGDDELYGDILDDEIHGGAGDDLLVGGHGADEMFGDGGNDWLRGDTNLDSINGGDGKSADGSDTASFMTAFPPGQPQSSAFGGVEADFDKHLSSGDGFEEPLTGIDTVVGSPFSDRFARKADMVKKRIFGGYGADVFDLLPADVIEPPPGPEPPRPYVYVDNQPRDLGLVLMGSTGNDVFSVTVVGKTIRVTSFPGVVLSAGPLCGHPDAASTHIVDCAIPHTLRYIAGWGDAGNDVFGIGPGLPRDITVHIDGGEGDDYLAGNDEEDVFFTGRTGKDKLEGNGGDDALISESTDADKAQNNVEGYQGGADILDAGPGNDQLVVDYPCGGHTYLCGGGRDVAGFARSGDRPISAQLGGPAQNKTAFYEYAYNPGVCGIKQGTHMPDGCEILEGSSGDDILHGNDGDNIIWGRKGNDKLTGNGGTDTLCGHEGDDTLFAKDGTKDRELVGETVFSDPNDPEKGLLNDVASFCNR